MRQFKELIEEDERYRSSDARLELMELLVRVKARHLDAFNLAGDLKWAARLVMGTLEEDSDFWKVVDSLDSKCRELLGVREAPASAPPAAVVHEVSSSSSSSSSSAGTGAAPEVETQEMDTGEPARPPREAGLDTQTYEDDDGKEVKSAPAPKGRVVITIDS